MGKSWDYNFKATNFVPLSIGCNSFIHSTNIHKISSVCWMLEIQSIHSSFQFTMLNVAPVPPAPKCLRMVISVQMQAVEYGPRGMVRKLATTPF